ncbi:hypothetical protein ACP4OV_023614 [Aristida adscensionis]
MDAARRGKGDLSLIAPVPTTPPPPPGSSPLPLPAAAAALVLALPASASRAPPAGPLASPLAAGAMDGGCGEPLLVRRSKGKKRPPQERAPAGGGGGGADRFHALWRDYHDLLEETEAKKRRIAGANGRKLSLLAEIKFLRRKYNSFVKYADSQRTLYKLKKQHWRTRSPVESNEASAFADLGGGSEIPSTSKTTHFDLNQDSVVNREGLDRRGHEGHCELDKFDDQMGVDEDTMAADVKLSICRDTGNSPASDEKRTISWQDRLALKA